MKKMEMAFVCEELNISEEMLAKWIECRLILPIDQSGPYFDEEDFSRIRFISEIQNLYGTNDESLVVILHLIDQIHLLRAEAKKFTEKEFK